jgi:hypothetical protein
MITILKKILIILAIIIVIDRIFSYFFIEYIFNKTISGESGGTLNYVITKKQNLDFLVIGASRAQQGIDPEVITSLGKNGYNLGINGTTPLNSLLNLDILIQNNIKPKTILLQTDLSNYVTDSNQEIIDQIKRVYPYNTKLTQGYVARVGYIERMKYFFGLYRLNRKILNIAFNFLKKDSVKNSSGYVGLPNMVDKPDVTYPTNTYIYQSTSTNAEAVRRIQKICNENNIKLIVVFLPSYNNVFRNEVQQKILIEDLHKNGITNSLDLSDIHLFPSLENEENWRDGIHLNATGSQKFSKILNEEIKKHKL